MSIVSCKVNSIEKLNDFLYRIFLQPDQVTPYQAGQYVSVVMGEKDKRHFSIANGAGGDLIELHIGATPENSYAMQVIDKMQEEGADYGGDLNGNAFLRAQSTRAIILVAGVGEYEDD